VPSRTPRRTRLPGGSFWPGNKSAAPRSPESSSPGSPHCGRPPLGQAGRPPAWQSGFRTATLVWGRTCAPDTDPVCHVGTATPGSYCHRTRLRVSLRSPGIVSAEVEAEFPPLISPRWRSRLASLSVILRGLAAGKSECETNQLPLSYKHQYTIMQSVGLCCTCRG
jgi:hypothetical protein